MLEEKAEPVFEALQRRAIEEKLIEPKVVYGYFPVQVGGDDLIVYHTDAISRRKPWNRAGKPRGARAVFVSAPIGAPAAVHLRFFPLARERGI